MTYTKSISNLDVYIRNSTHHLFKYLLKLAVRTPRITYTNKCIYIHTHTHIHIHTHICVCIYINIHSVDNFSEKRTSKYDGKWW